MPSINDKIEKIISVRAKHLPKITAQREQLFKVLTVLDKLDGLIGIINSEFAQQQGIYYSMIVEDPKMEKAFRSVNTSNVRRLIKEQLSKLDILEKRFGRNTICIAMIGYEGQGKSTFLQAISGLENNVIPAYSGASCTGAVSVIHNTDGAFRAEIEMYSLDEFLKIINEKLAKFFPNRTFHINSIDDLKTIDLDGFVPTGSRTVQLTAEFEKFKDAYYSHVDEYKDLLGRGKLIVNEESQVIKHVAQYEEFDTPPTGEYYTERKNNGRVVYKKNYYNYIAVKKVDIYKKFNLIDCRKVQLVDTIGMGDTSNAELIEREMFRVLREDCDAAVDLFKPDPLGRGFNQQQSDILDKISNQLSGREPSKWIVYVINKVSGDIGANAANIPSILNVVNKTLDSMPNRPIAWVKAIEGVNTEDVRENLVIPLLDLISGNLEDLDKNLMLEANTTGANLYSAFFKLTTTVESVLSSSVKNSVNEGRTFDDSQKKQLDDFFTALRKLDENVYGAKRSTPCPEISDCLEDTINDLYDIIPDTEFIEHEISVGAKNMASIFSECCDMLSNDIFETFENVSDDVIVPLREDVKLALAKCIFTDGGFGKVPLKGYSIKDGGSIEWLQCLLDERVSKDTYPHLYEALNYVLSYHFNIEDSIEYDVAQSIGLIDCMNNQEFMPLTDIYGNTVEERADCIWQELCNRISPMQQKLRLCRDKFALIPSHSFATRVQKFRTKIVRDEDVKSDLKEFYRDNCYVIWKDAFNNAADAAQAFGQWNSVSDELNNLCDKSIFELIK